MPSAPSPAAAVVDHVGPGTDVIVPLANGEPIALLDELERAAAEGRIDGVRVHQMHALHPRRYLEGAFGDRLRHVSYFLSSVTRPAFLAGTLDLVPSNFSEVPRNLRHTTKDPLVLAAASPMDRHGYFSLGTNADYTASFLSSARVFLEANARMPRTFGRNQIHASQVLGWCEVDRPLVEVPAATPSTIDTTIAGLVAERVPDGATIQAGIGAVPSSLLRMLHGHRHLGIHTELLTDDVVELVAAGAVDGSRKHRRPGRMVTTFCLGTDKLYDFVHDNPSLELLAVDWVNDPRVIAQEHAFMSINATTEVDFLGQCASETIGGRYWSGSGGQADFARGAMYAEGGRAFIVLHSTTRDGSFSRIRPVLTPGSAVTTLKNTVDHVVTEYGVAELRGRTIRERTAALIAVAHPRYRDELTAEAKTMGYLW